MLPPHIYYQTNASGQTKREWLDLPKTTRQSENQDYLLSFGNKATFLNKDASGIYTPAGGSVRPQDQKYIYDLLGQVQLAGYVNNPIRSSQDVMALHPIEASRHQFGGSAGNIRTLVSRAGPVAPWAVDLMNSVKSIRGGQVSGVPDASGENEGTDIGTPSLYRFPDLPASDPLSLKFAMSLLPDSTGLPPQKLLNVINIARQQGFHINTEHDPEKIIIQNKQNTLKADEGPQPYHKEERDIKKMLYGARHDIHVHRAHTLTKNQMSRRGRYNQGITNITNIYEYIRQDSQANRGNLPDGSTEAKKVMTTGLPVVDKMLQNENPNIVKEKLAVGAYGKNNNARGIGGFNSAFQYKLKETLAQRQRNRLDGNREDEPFSQRYRTQSYDSAPRNPHKHQTPRDRPDIFYDGIAPELGTDEQFFGRGNEHQQNNNEANNHPAGREGYRNPQASYLSGQNVIEPTGRATFDIEQGIDIRGDANLAAHNTPLQINPVERTTLYPSTGQGSSTEQRFNIKKPRAKIPILIKHGLNAAYPVINPGKRQRFTSASTETERMLRVYEETMDKVRRESAEKKRKLQEKHAARKNV